MDKARRNDSCPVDHYADDLALRLRYPSVEGMRRRGRRWIDPDQTKIACQSLQHVTIEWRDRAIVDDNHFVIVRVNIPLIGG